MAADRSKDGVAGEPLVTIVTPSFNQADFLQQTIDSVLAQDYPNIEYIVADGGSTDGSLDILKAADPRVQWTSAPDNGQADAIASAFVRARGEMLTWLNADDCYLPGAVSALAGALLECPSAGLAYGHADRIDAGGRILGPALQVEHFDLSRLRSSVDFVAQPASMFRRSAYQAVGGLDVSLNWSFDYDLWLRLGAYADVVFVNRLLAQMRIHAGAKTSTGALPRLLEIETMAKRHGRSRIPDGFAASVSWHQSRAAFAALRKRKLHEAAGHAVSALRHGLACAFYCIRRLPRTSRFDSAPR